MDKIPEGFKLVEENDPSIPEGFSLLSEEEENGLLEKGIGLADTAFNMVRGAAGQIGQGVTSLATLPLVGLKGANEIGQEVAQKIQGEPFTKKGKEYTEGFSKFVEDKIRQPMIKQQTETAKALPINDDILDENTRELLATIGTDTFLNFMPIDLGLRGARAAKPVPKVEVPKDKLSALDKLNELTKPKEEPVVPKPDVIQPELDLFSPDQKQIGQSPFDAVGGKFIVDENGIPVKQALSEDVSRAAGGDQLRLFDDPKPPVDPVLAKQAEQQAAERFAQEQELVKRKEIEDSYRQRAEEQARLEQEAKAARRDEILTKLEEEISAERVSKGQQRKADRLRAPRSQRGAIDAEAVKEMTQFFKDGFATAQDVFRTFKGAFYSTELEKATKALENPKSLDTIALMSPKQFHELAKPRTKEYLDSPYPEEKRFAVSVALKGEKGLADIPYLRIDDNGRITAHEGRHRMDVFSEQGYELVPVRLRKEAGEGWGTWRAPKQLIPEVFKDADPALQQLMAVDMPEVLHQSARPLAIPKSQRGALNFEDIVKSFPSFGKSLIKKALYHGTSSDIPFNNFKKNSRGIFLTEDPRVASDYARDNDSKTLKYENGKLVNKNTSDRVHQVYANIQNPYHLTPEEVRIFQRTENYAKMQREFKNKAEQLGHDGIIYPDGSIVAFSPDQIVSAISPLNTLKGPKLQHGGLDIKSIGEGAKELAKKITGKTAAIKETNVATKESVIESIPGHKQAMKDYIPADPTASEILNESLGAGDSNLKMTGVQSGATMTGIKYNSPLIQGIGRLYQNAQKRSEKLIRDLVYPVEYTFKKLSKQEIIDLSKVMKMEMFDGRLIDSSVLREAGFSDKQINAYVQMRDLFNKAYEVQAKALEAQNKKVPTKREAYLSSRWNGDWHVPIYTKDGKLVYYVAEKTKTQAYNALEFLKDQFDIDLDKSKVEYKAGHSKRGNVHDAYRTMLSIIDSNDPRAAAIKSVMEEAMANDAFNAMNQKKHFESKANIRGFMGDRPWVTDKTNAYDLFKSQFDYAKNAFTWTELQKATKTSKEVLSNDYLVQEQPNNLKYAQEYAKNKLGFGEANWVKEMENVANEMLGTSKQSFYNAVGDMKSFFIVSKLGFNTGFIAANMIQPVFTLPWHANLTSHGIPHNPFKTFVMGGVDAIAGYAKYALGVDLPMSELGKQALKYAEDNGIVRRSMFDETANLGRHAVIEGAEKVGSLTIQTVEHQARLTSFMSFVQHLDQSGMFPDPIRMFEKAEELTNAAMVDYRPGEGPMMFDNMGLAGEALKTLQTFKFNYYNQLHYFLNEAKEGRPRGLLTFMAIQGMLGGALGLPLLQEIDDLWMTIRDSLPNDLHAEVKDFSVKKKMIETMPDWLAYGGLSKLTGANFSSRFDSGNLMDFSLDSLFPFMKDISNQASKVYNYIKEPGTSTGAEALYALTPPGPLQGLLETNMDAFKGPKTPEGNQVYLNPRDLRKQDANYVRTPEQEAYRILGLTELNEAKYKAQRYAQNTSDKEADARRRELADKFFDSVINREDKTRDKIVYQYIKYGGDPQTLIDRLDSDAMRRALPQETLQAARAQTLTAIQKAKRMKEVLNGFNK